MKIKTYVSLAAMAVLLAACGKEAPPPLMSLPPVKETPKAAPAPVANEGGEKFLWAKTNDLDQPGVVGKSGKACNVTCEEQPTLAACQKAVQDDGCIEARDAWRAATGQNSDRPLTKKR